MKTITALVLLAAGAMDAQQQPKATVSDSEQVRYWKLAYRFEKATQSRDKAAADLADIDKAYLALLAELKAKGCEAAAGFDGLECKAPPAPAKPKP